MSDNKFCSKCGQQYEPGASLFCSKCGAKYVLDAMPVSNASAPVSSTQKSDKSATTALLLCLFLGGLGIHRFYVGKIGTGILMLLTCGGLGIWTLIDLITIACSSFTDKDGRLVQFDNASGSTAKKILFVLLIVFAAFSMFVITLLAVVMYATSGVVGTVRDQLEAIRGGDYAKAYSYTSQDFQNSTSLAEFTKYINSYPAMKDNKDSTFNDRSVENNTGDIKGYLVGKNGATTNIEYVLIKENGKWKILNIKVNPEGSGIQKGGSETSAQKTEQSSTSSSASDSGSAAVKINLPKSFVSESNKYSIKYPEDWEYTQPDKATVVFGGKEGTAAYNSTVNIQTILTKKNGGNYDDVESFMASLKKQAFEMSPDAKILSEDAISIDETANSIGMDGRYMVFTYTIKGVKYKQMQFVFERGDEMAFYAWGYTSTLDRYMKEYPIAKAMFGTWDVH